MPEDFDALLRLAETAVGEGLPACEGLLAPLSDMLLPPRMWSIP